VEGGLGRERQALAVSPAVESGSKPGKDVTVSPGGWVRRLLLVPLVALTPAVVLGQAAAPPATSSAELPAPWGLGLTIYDQNQDYRIKTLDVPLPGIDPQTLGSLGVDNSTTTYHLKLDCWVLPFLDVYAIFGQVTGATRVHLSEVDTGLPISLNNLVVDLDGLVYGGGLTLAGGWDHYFATLTFDYNETSLDGSKSSERAAVLTPRIGYHDGPAAVYVGAMYQRLQEDHQGVFTMPYLGSVPYKVELEQKDAWNYLVGLDAGVGEHWDVVVEGFFGPRTAVLGMLEYRWGKSRPF
jgi:hypothetical protein